MSLLILWSNNNNNISTLNTYIMKKLSFHLIVLLLLSTILLTNFSVNSQTSNSNDEFEVLISHFENNGNFINTIAPAIIPADEVKKNMKNPKYHIVDIRSDTWFDYGHIKGANNVASSDLPAYFESTINPKDFEKIVLICYSGQSAAYYTGLLRLSGYDNVYNMNWGMSSWREDFAANSWTKSVSDEFKEKLETTNNPKAEKGTYPSLSTGKVEAAEILKTRLSDVFAVPYKESIVKAEDVFSNPSDYYIVNYWENDKYNAAHIPTAIQYEPKGSLASSTDLSTLPKDKKIVVYGSTGQEAAYIVAYLDILGYDAYNLAYGANSFMNSELNSNNWDGFSKKEINMYPVIE